MPSRSDQSPAPPQPRKVLFVCTANHFRSRFAEALFNSLATNRELPWRASSCGFRPEDTAFGISPFTLSALKLCGVSPDHAPPVKQRAHEDLIEEAEVVVAMNREEHHPLMQTRFPGWEDRVRYWSIPDLPEGETGYAFSEMKRLVVELVEELGGNEPKKSDKPPIHTD